VFEHGKTGVGIHVSRGLIKLEAVVGHGAGFTGPKLFTDIGARRGQGGLQGFTAADEDKNQSE
jgi:hypothetical protein